MKLRFILPSILAVVLMTMASISVSHAAPPDDPVFVSDSINDYSIACGTLAKVSGEDNKARYYASAVSANTPLEYIREVITGIVYQIREAANAQEVSFETVAGYAFNNYGCNRPFI